MSSASGSSTGRKRYTVGEIKKVLRLWDDKFKDDRRGLQAHLKKEFKWVVSQGTLSDWKKRREEYLASAADDLKALRKPSHPEMEAELERLINRSNEAGLPVTSQQAQLRALSYVKKVDPTTSFKASPGWLHRAKRRMGVKSYRPRGEAQSADQAGVTTARRGMPRLLSDLGCRRPRDFYNLDETGMYPWAAPDRTLAFRPMRGRKKDMNRLTFMLCCSADGYHREELLVIGKAAKHRCFSTNDPRDWVTWEHNSAAWMTGPVFMRWLNSFNSKMRLHNRAVVLTMDNCSSHKVVGIDPQVLHGMECYALSNVTVVMLPKNTTSVVQPMDAGIIRSFKAKYKQWLVECLYQMYERVEWQGDLTKVRPNVGKCVIEAAKIWRQIPDGVIYNCFRHTGILPPAWMDLDVNEPATALDVLREATVAIQYTVDNMSRALPEPVTAEDFIWGMEGEDVTENPPDWDEVLERVREGGGSSEMDDEEDAIEPVEEVAAPTMERVEQCWGLLSQHVEAVRNLYGEPAVATFFAMKRRWQSSQVMATIACHNKQADVRMYFQAFDQAHAKNMELEREASAAGGTPGASTSALAPRRPGEGLANWGFLTNTRKRKETAGGMGGKKGGGMAPSRKGKGRVVEEEEEEEEEEQEEEEGEGEEADSSGSETSEEAVHEDDLCDDDSDADERSEDDDGEEVGELPDPGRNRRQRARTSCPTAVVADEEPFWVPIETPSTTVDTATEEAIQKKNPRKVPPKRSSVLRING